MGWSNPKTFIPYLAELYKEGKLPYDKIITKFPFSEINEVAKASAAGEIIKGRMEKWIGRVFG
jgi:Zn-dependent alcohol dehydrogenase